MKWGRRIAVTALLCAGAIALALALLLPRSREPVYQGHRLSWWIRLYLQNPDRHDEAQRAIQQIGTNALPTLLDWIRYDEPTWRTRLINHLYAPGGAPAFLQRPVLQNLALGTAGRHIRLDATTGLHALGPAAHPAAFELVTLSKSKSPFVSYNAMAAFLSMQGQKALILAEGLTNSESTIRVRAAKSIGDVLQPPSVQTFGSDTDPSPAVPLLIHALSDPDVNVRRAATNTLLRIAPETIEKGLPVPNPTPEKVMNTAHR